MAAYLVAALSGLASFQALRDWRRAVFYVVALAIVTDPLRKLTPGAPAYLMLATAPPILVIIFRMVFSRHRNPAERRIRKDMSGIGVSAAFLALACIPAASISATYGPGSWLLTLAGAASYGTLAASIYVGAYFSVSVSLVRRLIALYCLASLAMMPGAFLEYFGFGDQYAILGTDALQMDWVKYHGYETIKLIAGFYRSPDVMGWHAATVVMLSLLLFLTSNRKSDKRWMWVAIALIAAAALFLCGRRKMVFMIPIFLVFLTAFIALAGNRRWLKRIPALLLTPVIIGGLAIVWFGSGSILTDYYFNSNDQAANQISNQGFEGLEVTLQQSGLFGEGLGFATPGTQHLDVSRPRVWQESGSSRILVELGLPGAIALCVFLIVSFGRAFLNIRKIPEGSVQDSIFPITLLAIVSANVASLFISSQILADPFIVFFIGLMLGMSSGLASTLISNNSNNRGKPRTTYSQSRAVTVPGHLPLTSNRR